MQTRRGRRGAEAIEFALTLPILLLMIGGIADFGWFAIHQSSIQSAAAAGARWASKAPADADPVVLAQSQARASLDQYGVSATVTSRLVDMANGDKAVQVRITAPFSGLMSMVDLGLGYDAVAAYRLDIQP